MCLCIIEGIKSMQRMLLLLFTEADYTIPAVSKRAKAVLYGWIVGLTICATVQQMRIGQLQRDLNAANIAIYDLTHGGKP
jgi:hypothetical protein